MTLAIILIPSLHPTKSCPVCGGPLFTEDDETRWECAECQRVFEEDDL